MASLLIVGLAACSDDDVKVADDKLADVQKVMGGAYWAVESTDVVVGEGVNLSVEEAYKQGLLMDHHRRYAHGGQGCPPVRFRQQPGRVHGPAYT